MSEKNKDELQAEVNSKALETEEISEPVTTAETEQKNPETKSNANEPAPEKPIAEAEKISVENSSNESVLSTETTEPEEKTEEEEDLLVLPEIEEEEIDWDGNSNEDFASEYDNNARIEMEKLYVDTLNEINEKELIEGTVVGITNKEVIVNIGFKSDGLVARTEFRDTPDLAIGDKVEVYVEEQENAKGQLMLSRRKAKIVKAWELIQSALDNDSVINGMVKRRTKGGLIVDVYGVEAFLPGSQIDVKPIRDFDVFVGKEMEVKIVKINYTNDNVVVSHKVLIEKDIEEQKTEILNNLEKGQVLEGVIKNMTNFGVFIDLGGVDALLHITDISWGRINHPEEVLKLDEKVNVVVLDFDDDKKRISLGMKQLTAHPWDSLDSNITEGSRVKGKIVNVADYGAFLEIIPGVEGLIHVSEMSWSQHLRNPSDFMQVGDEMEAVVLTIDREQRKMSVGIKQLGEDPWTKQDILTKYALDTKHTGTVRNLTNFGLFIELEEGIDGLVHVSDLSWTKKIKHPSEFVKVNETLEVIVMELDVENRRLALSHKHLEENPWETFESIFEKGTIHKCTVISTGDKGAILELPYGIEGHVSGKNLVKADGSKAQEGETLDFRIMDFMKEEKRIHLSHSATWKEVKEESKKKPSGKKSKTLGLINKEVEKSTLGDLDALSELKQKMEAPQSEKEPKKKAQKKTEISDTKSAEKKPNAVKKGRKKEDASDNTE